MFLSDRSKNQGAKTPDLVETDIDDVDVDDLDVDVDDVATQKRHFLDYDAVPPPDFEESFDRALTLSIGVSKPNELNISMSNHSSCSSSNNAKNTAAGEQLKMDKKYERDGEVSDYELAACGYTKKEFTQDDNTLHLTSAAANNAAVAAVVSQVKAKHFLDENPIPPDYMLQQELRQQRTDSPVSRKSSLDRASSTASSREFYAKEPSYTLSRFLDSDTPIGLSNNEVTHNSAAVAVSLPSHSYRLPNKASESSLWSESRHSSMQLSLPAPDAAASADKENMGSKVECVYSLLSMLGTNNPLDMSKKFLELSRTPETCATLRRSGCVPLLVQMVYAEGDEHVRKCANAALHNVVHSYAEDKVGGRREAKVLRLLDQIVDYCQFLKTLLQSGGEAIADDYERHPLAAISSLMKVSFDEEHRHAMVELGALHAIPSLVQLDHAVHGPIPEDQCCNSLRRYALMALTNLTFGDENNKALLCSQKTFMEALVAQLDCAPDDLLQVTASVLRNLSWRADSNMKAVLNEIGTVTALARAAMKNKSENTLKAILSALWNLSAHCSMNKAEFCAVEGALAFLVDMLTYEGPSKTLKIIENAGGILRNVSSHIAVREHYRQILRERNCLSILLQQLKSESLTVVSNSCGTLWNLSARCPEDQKFLWDNGAVPMLRSLIHSKHTMISEGSASALKNLLNFRPSVANTTQMDAIARSMGLKQLPTLNVRKQKALAQELGEQHAETCENIDASDKESIKEQTRRLVPLAVGGVAAMGGAVQVSTPGSSNSRLTRSAMLTKSESRDSVFSAKSDTTYEHIMRSHSASDANRGQVKVKYPPPFASRAAFVTLENEVEEPTNYSVKYNEKSTTTKHIKEEEEDEESSKVLDSKTKTKAGYRGAYQETDLDQLTDFSLRYAENQIESDVDVTPPEATAKNAGNEILLILEDSVKCYQTEDTPYVISNAASVTDLRQQIKTESTAVTATPSTTAVQEAATAVEVTTVATLDSAPTGVSGEQQEKKKEHTKAKRYGPHVQYGCGSYTPEKPVNYCEEGTPAGYFSRYESLSSLDEPPAPLAQVKEELAVVTTDEKPAVKEKPRTLALDKKPEAIKPHAAEPVELPNAPTQTSSSMLNSAQETPLMFSRHSSMDSLVEADVGPLDDKSSVISDYSRLASGVISPSEIPDSPTQSMPQSPRRLSAYVPRAVETDNQIAVEPLRPVESELEKPLRSVFEDDLNMFHVENTPAQFSTATSLSNLSIMDDEQLNNSGSNATSTTPKNGNNSNNSVSVARAISEGEEEEEEEDDAHQDDMLLANCINMGMNRNNMAPAGKAMRSTKSQIPQPTATMAEAEEMRRYCTEDTPALLSKTGSTANLSVISICSSDAVPNASKPKTVAHEGGEESKTNNRHSMNLSDDVSSNASEIGAAADILQQCIRAGIEKSIPQVKQKTNNPIAMLRCGGTEPMSLPTYLPVTDEMNKFLVENSPCTFSVMSELSNLTVGSSLVGPAVQLKTPAVEANEQKSLEGRTRRESHGLHSGPNWQNDSLSSLSIDSEDDSNLILSQAIAAGCNRPKSNLGFCSANVKNSHAANSLSASQPLPINAVVAGGTSVSVSALNTLGGATSSSTTRRHQQQTVHTKSHKNNKTKQQQKHKHDVSNIVNGNESCSSVDSSDSNDNQSKSLFEMCILTGMNKASSSANSRKLQHQLPPSQSQQQQQHQFINSSRSRSAALGVGVGACANDIQSMTFNKQKQPEQQQQHNVITPNRNVRERERKDEKLLLECINTGISKKITKDGVQNKIRDHHHHHPPQHQEQSHHNQQQQQPLPFATNIVPKNVQATSAAALEATHQMADITYTNARSTVAVSDVEKNNINYNCNNNNNINITNNSLINNNIEQQYLYNNSNNLHNYNNNNSSSNNNTNINQEDIIGVAKNQVPVAVAQQMYEMAAKVADDVPPNPEIIPMTMNAIGYKNNNYNHEDDETNTSSDDSNVSLLMEPPTTTTSLCKADESEQYITRSAIMEKHKDPDLMLKSVERLTLEFVSSAEQLRITSNNNGHNRPQARLGSISLATTTNNSSNNTWNENTCPNDVSFPSISLTAPIVASLKDDDVGHKNETDEVHKELHDFAEITPTNEEQPASMGCLYSENEREDFYDEDQQAAQINSLESVTLKQESQEYGSGINFQLGGEVQVAAASPHQLFYANGTNTAMTNSTIIAIEARALADNWQHVERGESDHDEHSLDLTFSVHSLDLDNVRPPSGMESLNISGYYADFNMPRVMPASPQYAAKSPKFPRKSLPAGLMARRALGQLPAHLTGSAESVNSSCNLLLDNVRPPSLMDDLLDSMISVDSIQSEVADCESLATTVSLSNYETAAGGDLYEDNTVTLQSCCNDMSHDDATEVPDEDDDTGDSSSTPLCSDGGQSTGSAQNKRNGGVKRTLTPKQKRKLAQDRFKTYTIAADMVLEEERLRLLELPVAQPAQADEEVEDEILQIEFVHRGGEVPTVKKNFNRRRSESQDRYKTQTIVYPGAVSMAGSGSFTDDPPSEEISSIRALTARFQYIQAAASVEASLDESSNSSNNSVHKSVDYEQNSETESCHGDDVAKCQEVPCARIVTRQETDDNAETESEQVKVVRGRKKTAYVSPYSKQATRQTTPRAVLTRTNKSLEVANKSPIKSLKPTKINFTSVKKVTPPIAPIAPIERQGTFVQEEPTVDTAAVPVVASPTARASKLPTKRIVSQIARKVVTPRGKPPTVPSTPQRSNSNSNLRQQSSATRMAALSARGVTTTPPSRSNSNLNSAASGGKLQQAQSRIASIWKRVDEAKSKQNVKPTTTTVTREGTERQMTTTTKTSCAAKIPVQSKIAVNRSNFAITRRNI